MGSPPGAIRLSAHVRLAVVLVLLASPALAQSRLALDVVAAVDGQTGSEVRRDATGWFDVFAAVRLADNIDLRARPVVYRRSFNGTWTTQMYELALRYERPGAVGLRLEAGQFSSPVGLGILENRPDRNPVVSPHSTLYLPIPRYEPGTPTTFLLAASYPFGARVTLSGAKWDVRSAITDSSPIRGRPFFGDNKPPRMANYMVGAGFTPYIGVRVGAAMAFGPYAARAEVRNQSRGDRQARLIQLEGEWSFGHTRFAGEWLWTERELALSGATVNGGWLEATQTLTPRVFVAARYDEQWTRWTSAADRLDREEPYRRVETAVGFRLSPDLTLRGSFLTRRGYVVGFWDDQFVASIVYAKKFF